MMWHEPPKHTEPDHGQARMWSEPWQLGVRPSLPVVSVRVTVMRLSNVDTAQHTASCKVGVTFLWTDERLKGYDQFLLPGTLWGPELYLMNTVEVKREYEQVSQESNAIAIANANAIAIAITTSPNTAFAAPAAFATPPRPLPRANPLNAPLPSPPPVCPGRPRQGCAQTGHQLRRHYRLSDGPHNFSFRCDCESATPDHLRATYLPPAWLTTHAP